VTREQALLDAVASVQAASVLSLAIEEAGIERNRAAREFDQAVRESVQSALAVAITDAATVRNDAARAFAQAVRKSVAHPDDRIAAQAARRAAGAHARALGALLELRAARDLNCKSAHEVAAMYGLDFAQIVAEAEARRACSSGKPTPQSTAEAGAGGYIEASPGSPTSPTSGPRQRALVEA
jgi:hypothetical protein